MPTETVTATYAPTLQRYLTGPLARAAATRPHVTPRYKLIAPTDGGGMSG